MCDALQAVPVVLLQRDLTCTASPLGCPRLCQSISWDHADNVNSGTIEESFEY